MVAETAAKSSVTSSLGTRVDFVRGLVLCLTLLVIGCQPATQPISPGSTNSATPAPATSLNSEPLAPSTLTEPAATNATDNKARLVTIAAASDLKFALDELLVEFGRKHPEIQTKATYGSSGNFFAQLSNKAPFDLFLSADMDYPRKLIEQDLAARESEFSYAVGHVVVWVRRDSALKVEEAGIQTLLDPSVKKISIANPKHAPYGRAAVASLKSLAVYEQVEDKLVLAENIAQTAQFIETGAADAGIISLSLATAPVLKDKGRYWSIPASAHPPIEQGGCILSWSKDRDAANAVRMFLMSEEGRQVLKKYGFDQPVK